MSCNCQVCQDLRRWRLKIHSDSQQDREEVFQEMFGRIEDAETDLSYYRALVRGEWPRAETILEHALAKIREAKNGKEET